MVNVAAATADGSTALPYCAGKRQGRRFSRARKNISNNDGYNKNSQMNQSRSAVTYHKEPREELQRKFNLLLLPVCVITNWLANCERANRSQAMCSAERGVL